MRSSVQSAFQKFNEQFEGCVPYMYLDVKGLVTVAVGNLIDPVGLAQALPFRFKNKPGIANPGGLATPEQIAAEWQRLKSNPDLGRRGFQACEPITDVELADDSINSLVLKRVGENENFLGRQQWFSDFDSWPADAQLGLLSMAWAMGPAGPGQFSHFRAACQGLDFETAAAECKISEVGIGGSLINRNKANFTLFSNAAAILAGEPGGKFNRDTLYYPQTLQGAGGAQSVPASSSAD